LVVFIAVQNLVGIDAVVLIICMFFDFTSLAWKRLFTPPKWFFWGIWPPKRGAILTRPPKGTNGCRNTSYDPLSVKIALKMRHVGVAKYGYVNKKPRRYRVFSRMRRAATAESILIKFGTSTPWADLVIYLKRHPNWSKIWGGGGVRNFAYPIDFAIGF